MLSISPQFGTAVSRRNRRAWAASFCIHCLVVAALLGIGGEAPAPTYREDGLAAKVVMPVKLAPPDLSFLTPKENATSKTRRFHRLVARISPSKTAAQPLATATIALQVDPAETDLPVSAIETIPPPEPALEPSIGAATVSTRTSGPKTARLAGFDSAAPQSAPSSDDRAIESVGFSASEAEQASAATRRIAAAGFFGADGNLRSVPSKPSVSQAAAGFGGVVVQREAADRRNDDQQATAERPPKILDKPKPEYTEAARLRKIEGESVLEVLLAGSGEARVLRVVEGLGYGLDERAVAAVNGIRFEPALRDGRPVDAVVTMRIRFQLAL